MGSQPPAVRQRASLSSRAALGLLVAMVIVIAASFIAMHAPAFRSAASGAMPASMNPLPQRSGSSSSHGTTTPEGSISFHLVSLCAALVGTFVMARRIVRGGHVLASTPPAEPHSVPSRHPTRASVSSLLCIQRC